jgi:hypothetical protein
MVISNVFKNCGGDIHKSRCTTRIKDPVTNFATSSASVVDTGGKVSTTPVSMTLVKNNENNIISADNLKGLSHEIDFKIVDINLQNLV